MELIIFLTQQRDLIISMINCLEREKQALIKEEAQTLLEIIDEKKHLMNTLDTLEAKRNEMYPEINIRKMEEAGILSKELKTVGDELRDLVEKVQQLQETNHLLTQQSLDYTNQMLTILGGNRKTSPSSYGPNGKMGNKSNKNNTVLNHSV